MQMEGYLPRMKWKVMWPRCEDRAMKSKGWQGRYARTTPEGSWDHKNTPGTSRGSRRQNLEMSCKASSATTETPLLWHSQHLKNTSGQERLWQSSDTQPWRLTVSPNVQSFQQSYQNCCCISPGLPFLPFDSMFCQPNICSAGCF